MCRTREAKQTFDYKFYRKYDRICAINIPYSKTSSGRNYEKMGGNMARSTNVHRVWGGMPLKPQNMRNLQLTN